MLSIPLLKNFASCRIRLLYKALGRAGTSPRSLNLRMSDAASAASDAAPCNCLALRQAARRVTQLYDRHLAAAGLRSTQYSILAKLKYFGPATINALAARMVLDRTTLGRNIQPLQRQGLIAIKRGLEDFKARAVLPFTSRLRTPLRPSSRTVWADGDHVIVHWSGEALAGDGQPYRNRYAWIFRMRDGRAVEVTAFLDLAPYEDVIRRVPAPACCERAIDRPR